jgi:hypothetical protein
VNIVVVFQHFYIREFHPKTVIFVCNFWDTKIVQSSCSHFCPNYCSFLDGINALWHKNPHWPHPIQGCQMVYFQTKNPNLGKFWRVLQWQDICTLWTFGIFYSQLLYFMAIWYILWLFGIYFPVLVCCIEKNLETLILSLHTIHVAIDLGRQKRPKRKIDKISTSASIFRIPGNASGFNGLANAVLGPILRNFFGRNLPIKNNLVCNYEQEPILQLRFTTPAV